MSKPTFRDYVERRAKGDSEARELLGLLDDELLDAPSWRQSVDILRLRQSPVSFIVAYRKLWDDFHDLRSTIDRKRAEALRR